MMMIQYIKSCYGIIFGSLPHHDSDGDLKACWIPTHSLYCHNSISVHWSLMLGRMQGTVWTGWQTIKIKSQDKYHHYHPKKLHLYVQKLHSIVQCHRISDGHNYHTNSNYFIFKKNKCDSYPSWNMIELEWEKNSS